MSISTCGQDPNDVVNVVTLARSGLGCFDDDVCRNEKRLSLVNALVRVRPIKGLFGLPAIHLILVTVPLAGASTLGSSHLCQFPGAALSMELSKTIFPTDGVP